MKLRKEEDMPDQTKLVHIYFLTGNRNKFNEASSVLKDFGIKITMIDAKKIEVQHEDVKYIVKWIFNKGVNKIKRPTLIEDSGLYIHCLNGFPGPYSSYVFKTLGVTGVLKLLENFENKKAEFRSALAFGDSRGLIGTVIGITRGTISSYPRGNFGFGFDPIFIPENLEKTFGEMQLQDKNKYSHRAKALRKFVKLYKNNKKKYMA